MWISEGEGFSVFVDVVLRYGGDFSFFDFAATVEAFDFFSAGDDGVVEGVHGGWRFEGDEAFGVVVSFLCVDDVEGFEGDFAVAFALNVAGFFDVEAVGLEDEEEVFDVVGSCEALDEAVAGEDGEVVSSVAECAVDICDDFFNVSAVGLVVVLEALGGEDGVVVVTEWVVACEVGDEEVNGVLVFFFFEESVCFAEVFLVGFWNAEFEDGVVPWVVGEVVVCASDESFFAVDVDDVVEADFFSSCCLECLPCHACLCEDGAGAAAEVGDFPGCVCLVFAFFEAFYGLGEEEVGFSWCEEEDVVSVVVFAEGFCVSFESFVVGDADEFDCCACSLAEGGFSFGEVEGSGVLDEESGVVHHGGDVEALVFFVDGEGCSVFEVEDDFGFFSCSDYVRVVVEESGCPGSFDFDVFFETLSVSDEGVDLVSELS